MKKFFITLLVILIGISPAYCIKDVPPNAKVEYTNIEWWSRFNDPILTEYVVKTAGEN